MKKTAGFTAVELLVTLIVGMILMMAGYQLYLVVTKDSAETVRRASASNVAYELLRTNSSLAAKPCTATSATPTVPATANLPAATASVQVTCPSTAATDISLVTVTVTYGNPQRSISHATYVKKS